MSELELTEEEKEQIQEIITDCNKKCPCGDDNEEMGCSWCQTERITDVVNAKIKEGNLRLTIARGITQSLLDSQQAAVDARTREIIKLVKDLNVSADKSVIEIDTDLWNKVCREYGIKG